MSTRDLKEVMYNTRKQWKKGPVYVRDYKVPFPEDFLYSLADYDATLADMKGKDLVESYNNYIQDGSLLINKEIIKQAI